MVGWVRSLPGAALMLLLLGAAGPVGRRLDFLCQEFNREANTLCAKSADVELTDIGLALKAAIEQLREQVQTLTRNQMVRDLLEADGRTLADLNPTQRKLLLEQTSEENMRTLLESWPAYQFGSGGGGERPVEASESFPETTEELVESWR